MRIVFVISNQDPKRVSDRDFEIAVLAARAQQVDFADGWGRDVAEVTTKPPLLCEDGLITIPVTLRESIRVVDPEGAVAYHSTDENGNPYVAVLTDVVAELIGKFLDQLTIALTHEIPETVEDLYGNEWADLPNGYRTPEGKPLPDGSQQAHEACDRVQSASYAKEVTCADGTIANAQVSNFLLPPGFSSTEGLRYDYMRLLKHPAETLADNGNGDGGGYLIARTPGGKEAEVFGDKRAALAYSHHTLVHRGVDVEAVRAAVRAMDDTAPGAA